MNRTNIINANAHRSPARSAALWRVLALLLALSLLAGCGAGRDRAGASGTFGTEPPGESGAAQDGAAGGMRFISGCDGTGETAFTEDGMYYVEYGGDLPLLCYRDFAAGESGPFCHVSGCSHTDESCAAYAGPWALIATDSGRLLCFHWADSGLTLCAAGLESGQMVRLCSFDPDEEISSEMAGDGRSLYYLVITDPGPGVVNRFSLERFDLPTLTRTKLCDLSGDESFFLVAAGGDSLILKSFDSEGGITLWRYDLSSGNMTALMQGKMEKDWLDAYEDWLFRFEGGADGETIRLKAENWRDGRSFEMPGCFTSATGYAGIHPAGFFHNTLFVQSVDGFNDAEGDLIIRQYAINCETQSLREATHLDPVTRRPQTIAGGYTAPDGTKMLMIKVYEFSGTDKESYTGPHYEEISLEEYLS